MAFDPQRHARENPRGRPVQQGNIEQGNIEQQGSTAQGSTAQGSTAQGSTAQGSTVRGSSAQGVAPQQASTRVTTTQQTVRQAPAHETVRAAPAHTATMTREREVRPAPPPAPPPPPQPRSHLPMKILGILGLLALGGLIAGLVASHRAPTAPATHVVPPAARQLNSFGAHGPGTGPAFTVPTNQVTSTYGYACPQGTSGHFEANLVGDGSSQAIVNTNAPSASGSKVLPIHDVGGQYHVAVTAPGGCGYRINTGTR